ncbi:hypothetical protein BH10ACI1_BH10ACI1_10840 [soil metagenome]
MKKIRINQKQHRLENESQLAEKRKEFEAEYYEKQRRDKELGWDKVFPLPPLDQYIERESKEWSDKQIKVPSGMYQDWMKVCSEYQQKFIKYVCKYCPKVFDELRQFVTLFNEVFGKKNECHNLIFDPYQTEIIELNSSLISDIKNLIVENKYLDFKPYRINDFDNSFRWGENRLLFNLLARKLVSPDDSEKKKELLDDIFGMIQKDLKLAYHLRNEKIDEDVLKPYISNISFDIVEGLLFGDGIKYFNNQANDSITRYLKHILKGNEQNYNSDEIEPNINAFIKLQCELLNWAVRHNLGKDWVLRYAYYFLSKFSEDANVKVSEMGIYFLQARSLAADPFEFKFNGWLAGDESREDYEQRLREQFETELKNYFNHIHQWLGLDKQKRPTRPKDYDRVKWLVRWTVQNWSKDDILYEISLSDSETKVSDISSIDKAFREFKKYDLPVRT